MSDSILALDRVTLAASALLGSRRGELLAAADLGYFRGYWSRWIAEEMVRTSTTLVISQAEDEGATKQELKRRLERSSELINVYWDYCSQVLTMVDVAEEELPDLAWLESKQDRRTMGTAIAVGAPSTLVTDGPEAFSSGEAPGGLMILRSGAFLEALYQSHDEAREKVAEYLATDNRGGPRGGPRMGIVPPPTGRRSNPRRQGGPDRAGY